MSDKEKKLAKGDSVQDSSAKKSSKDSKESGGNKFFGRIGKFFKEYRGEIKKISWPTFPEVVRNTLITLAVVLIIGVFIWVFDFAFGSARDMVITSEEKKAPVTQIVPSDSTAENTLPLVSNTDGNSGNVSDSDNSDSVE